MRAKTNLCEVIFVPLKVPEDQSPFRNWRTYKKGICPPDGNAIPACTQPVNILKIFNCIVNTLYSMYASQNNTQNVSLLPLRGDLGPGDNKFLLI